MGLRPATINKLIIIFGSLLLVITFLDISNVSNYCLDDRDCHRSKKYNKGSESEKIEILMQQQETLLAAVNKSANLSTVNQTWPIFRPIFLAENSCERRRKPLLLLIYVHSAPGNMKRRQFIRESFGSSLLQTQLNFVLVFMLGKENDPYAQHKIAQESARYQDIVQEDFADTYRNLTYKAVMALRWITVYCSDARFVLKLDDDVFVNIFHLIKHIRTIKRLGLDADNTLYCHFWYRTKVIRDQRLKWYVSKEEYPDDYYATYCSGAAFIMSGDLPAKLFKSSLTEKFFWIDDYFVTGALAKKIGVNFQQWSTITSLKSSDSNSVIQELVHNSIVFAHLSSININTKYRIWKHIYKSNNSMEA